MSCDTQLSVDIHAEWGQCGPCVLADRPNPYKQNRPAYRDDDSAPDQLELGEVAS